MSDASEDGGSDSREFHGLKISDLLKALAERESRDVSHTPSRSISTTLSAQQEMETFRARAVLPENIKQLSSCRYKRHDYLKELPPASVPAPSAAKAGKSYTANGDDCVFT